MSDFALPTTEQLAELHQAARSLAAQLYNNDAAYYALLRTLEASPSSINTSHGKPIVVAAAHTYTDQHGVVRVLLGRRAPEYCYHGNWELFGGKVEATDSTIRDGLKRELREEIGVKSLKVKAPIYNIALRTRGPAASETGPMRCWVEMEGIESGNLELNKEHDKHGMFTLEDVNGLQMSNGMRSSIYTVLYMAKMEFEQYHSLIYVM